MNRTLLACLAALVTLPTAPYLQAQQKTPVTHTFSTEADHFTLAGKPFKVLSSELHYARIPREYWHARLKLAKAMGLNTIATYVFWNVHEPAPGNFDFTGNNDLAAFIRAAQEEGLYVILRAGPYSCAEWEFGGLPAWLLNDSTTTDAKMPHAAQPHREGREEQDPTSPGFPLRSNDSAFIIPAERWIHRLAQEVAPLQIGRGGPILMTQVENEYGNFGSDHAYIAHLKQIFLDSGFTDSLLYTADTLAGHPLTNWQIYPLPMITLPRKFVILSASGSPASLLVGVKAKNPRISSDAPQTPPASPSFRQADFHITPKRSVILRGAARALPSSRVEGPAVAAANSAPLFRRAHFNLTQLGDTFLDIHTLGKGALWINGHPIGRFWNIGPQQTLFVPAPWLRKGTNEIVVFDMLLQLPPP